MGWGCCFKSRTAHAGGCFSPGIRRCFYNSNLWECIQNIFFMRRIPDILAQFPACGMPIHMLAGCPEFAAGKVVDFSPNRNVAGAAFTAVEFLKAFQVKVLHCDPLPVKYRR